MSFEQHSAASFLLVKRRVSSPKKKKREMPSIPPQSKSEGLLPAIVIDRGEGMHAHSPGYPVAPRRRPFENGLLENARDTEGSRNADLAACWRAPFSKLHSGSSPASLPSGKEFLLVPDLNPVQ